MRPCRNIGHRTKMVLVFFSILLPGLLSTQVFNSGLVKDESTGNNVIKEKNMRTSSAAIPRANIAFVFNETIPQSSVSANNFKGFLDGQGFPTTLIEMGSMSPGNFTGKDVILLDSGTGYLSTWGNNSVAEVTLVNATGLPILGLGKGGNSFFGKLGLKLGWPYGVIGSANTARAVDERNVIFNYPFLMPNGTFQVYTTPVPSVEISPSSWNITVVPLAAENALATSPYTLMQEWNRYILWGFTESPANMTTDGKHLLINTIIFHAMNRTIKAVDTTWKPIIAGASNGSPSEILPKSLFQMGLAIDSNVPGYFMMNNSLFQNIQLPKDAGQVTEVGAPAVPVVTKWYEIPAKVTLSPRILYKIEGIPQTNVIVQPAQEPKEDLVRNFTANTILMNRSIYSTDQYYPSSLVKIDGGAASNPIMIRGRRLMAVHLYPIQFNPVQQRLRTYAKIEVQFDFDSPGQIQGVDARLKNPAFESLTSAVIGNYRIRPLTPTNATANGAEYLIICNRTFEKTISPLRDWKMQKGVTTRIAVLESLNSPHATANDIRSYIRNAYNTWNPAPAYVLLVGDSNFIPPFYVTPHPEAAHGGFKIPTDLYYGCVDGDDYFPDIFVGRFSGRNSGEISTQVTKTINYEKTPPDIPDFYKQFLGAAFFEDDNNDGYEDRRFTLTAVEIHDWLVGKGYSNTATSQLYAADSTVTPRHWSNDFDSGTAVPGGLLKPGFAWNAAEPDIINGFNTNNGVFFAYHRDHGYSANMYWHGSNNFGGGDDSWSSPFFNANDAMGLANGDRLPFVASVECLGGWYDSEVDQNLGAGGGDVKLTRDFQSVAENFMRDTSGGAIGVVAASRVSYSGYNDAMMKGFVDGIWPGLLGGSSGGLYHFGEFVDYGKTRMASSYGVGDGQTKVTYELFNLFGDPETELWTAYPQNMVIHHPAAIGSGFLQHFVVTVNDTLGQPLENARVCIQYGSDLQVVATDSNGVAEFSYTPGYTGSANITVTKHNYRPYWNVITVTSGGAMLTVSPNIGPDGTTVTISGSNFQSTETAWINFGATTITSISASGGSFTTTYTVPAGIPGMINVFGKGLVSSMVGIDVFRRLPHGPLPDPYIYDQFDSSTWFLHAGDNPVWDNPSIQLYDMSSNPVSSNDLVIATSYKIGATVRNDIANTSIPSLKVFFKWASWGAGQITWHDISFATVSLPAGPGGSVQAQVTWTPATTGHVCIKAIIEHNAYDIDWNNNEGQENTHVSPTHSPANVTIPVTNPTTTNQTIYIELVERGYSDQGLPNVTLWPTQVLRAYPQVQSPGETKNITITVDTPAGTKPGEIRYFTATCYLQNGTLIGGIDFEIMEAIPPAPPSPVIIVVIIVVAVAAVTMVVLVRRWRVAKIKRRPT